MSFFENNKDKINIGMMGEGKVREWVKSYGYPFMQVDIMFKKGTKWFLGEIKAQEKFKAPPFDGHGLPKWQIDMRLKLEKEKGIIAYLFVYDINDKCIYYQQMRKLISGEKLQTKGQKPRLIFPLKSFVKIDL